MNNSVKILLFAKAPIAGKVKTRLVPYLSMQQAADVYQKLLNTVIKNISQAGLPIEVWRTGDLDHSCWKDYKKNALVELFEQPGGDLGQRMAFAAGQALTRSDKVILVGGDCIDIDAKYIASAVKALNDKNVVVGPAEDGGYVLLGLNKFSPEVFSNINWGSASVLQQTLGQLSILSWSYDLLPCLNDIDRPEDLIRLSGTGDWQMPI